MDNLICVEFHTQFNGTDGLSLKLKTLILIFKVIKRTTMQQLMA